MVQATGLGAAPWAPVGPPVRPSGRGAHDARNPAPVPPPPQPAPPDPPRSRREWRLIEHGGVPRPRVAFRPDVEGLRAVAVLLVVAFHAGIGPLPGGYIGVDVFFVISGFLITSLLVDEVRATGSISLAGFYARRARRILPAACLVLAVTAIAGALVLPELDRPTLAVDVRSAALLVSNWHFAALSNDYFAAPDSSLVLHYWSLSLEEQFYLLWPVLILLVTRRRRTRRRARPPAPRDTDRRLWATLAPVALLSLGLSAATTAPTGPWAYFGTHTRGWELGAGAAIALIRPYLHRLSEFQAAACGWAGLAAILGSAVVLGDQTLVPGVVLLIPVLGTAAVVAAGGRTQRGAAALLSRGPLAALGRLSYSWYLWHWPCLQLARQLWGAPAQDDLPPPDVSVAVRLAAVVVSLGLAVLTFRFVEEPARNARVLRPALRRSLPAGAVLVAATVVLATVVLPDREPAIQPVATGQEQAVRSIPPASSTREPPVSRSSRLPVTLPAALTMTAAEARDDIPATRDCFAGFGPRTAPADCRFGDPAGTKVVAFFGDSHADAWFPAVDAAARRAHWQLWFWAKSGCGYADVQEFLLTYHRPYTECSDWRASVLARIDRLPRVDLVVVGRSISYLGELLDGQGNLLDRSAAGPVWSAGADRTFVRLAAHGSPVVLLRDVPRPGFDVPACLSEHAKDPTACDFPRPRHVWPDAALFAAEGSVLTGRGVDVVDLTSALCPGDPCQTVSPDGAILYRDDHHLTATFAGELAGAMQQALTPLVAGSPSR